MEIKVILYGIAKDIIGTSKYNYQTDKDQTVAHLLEDLKEKFPKLKALTSILVAVNDEYADMDRIIVENDEVVLVPPVSGG